MMPPMITDFVAAAPTYPSNTSTNETGADNNSKIVPEKMIDYDGAKMFAHTAGTLDESQLGPARSSDSERLQRELEKRGLS